MGMFSYFFQGPKIRQFHHECIYYDPKKEERENRERRIRAELGLEKSSNNLSMMRKGVFQEQRKAAKSLDESRRRRVIILAVVIGALFLYIVKF
ncbi:MAG: hypothetical protein IK017_00080 [Paludibacteraceae bacterium]|nr:hypothetical protein [Paludibacteraceae bacterium]MBR5971031.1 hypothetical protein [Paludibacteraceae bacterium]